MKKKVFLVLAVLFVAFFVWRVTLLVTGKSKMGANRPVRPPVAVEVADVTHEPVKEIHQFTGTVYPIYQYVLAPKVAGRIIELKKRIGDPVRKGEIIARVDDAEYQQAVLEAEANLKIAQASIIDIKGQAELAKQELDRAQSLRDKGISSPSELDAAVSNNTALQARLKLSQAQVEQREAALKSAQIRLGYTVLVAPEPGFVGERFVDGGSLLAPNSPVLTVVGIDRVIVRTTIIERDYGRITPGQSATVEVDAFSSEQFAGTVSRIAPVLQESARMANTEIDVDNSSHKLKPGMFARVNIVFAEKTDAQVVPSQAIVTGRGSETGNGIFIISDASPPVARFVPVETGIVTPNKTEILSPTLEGKVVTLGQHLLSDGSPVILPDKGAGSGPGRGKGGERKGGRKEMGR